MVKNLIITNMENLRKTVLVDHDQTISPSTSTLRRYVYKETGVHIPYRGMTSHNIETVFPEATTAIVQFVTSVEHLNKGKPHQKSDDGFRLLRDAGYRIIIATARPKHMEEKTVEWYRQRGLLSLVDSIQACPEGLRGEDFKVGLAQELAALSIFEDAPHNALSLAGQGFNVELISRPWNRQITHPLIRRSPSFYRAVLKFLGSQNGK